MVVLHRLLEVAEGVVQLGLVKQHVVLVVLLLADDDPAQKNLRRGGGGGGGLQGCLEGGGVTFMLISEVKA